MADTSAPSTGAPPPVEAVNEAGDNTPAEPTNPTEGMTPAEIKKWKLKVDGEELEVDEAELLRGYGTQKSATRKAMEAAEIKRQANEFVRMLKEDPWSVLSNPALGHDAMKLAEEYILKQIEEQEMDPRDRENRDLKRKLDQIESAKKKQEEEEAQRQLDELASQAEGDLTTGIIGALEESTLPRNEYTISRMAYYMHQALKQGGELTPKQAVEYVRKEIRDQFDSLFGASDEDTFLSLVGDAGAEKIRKADLKKFKAGQKLQPLPRPEDRQVATRQEVPKKKKSLHSFINGSDD